MNILTPASDIHLYTTILVANQNFFKPLACSTYGISTFKFSAVKIWESIPPELNLFSCILFKKHDKSFLLTTQNCATIILLVRKGKNCCTICRTSFFFLSLVGVFVYSSSLVILFINVIQIVLNIRRTPAYMHMTLTNSKALVTLVPVHY